MLMTAEPTVTVGETTFTTREAATAHIEAMNGMLYYDAFNKVRYEFMRWDDTARHWRKFIGEIVEERGTFTLLIVERVKYWLAA